MNVHHPLRHPLHHPLANPFGGVALGANTLAGSIADSLQTETDVLVTAFVSNEVLVRDTATPANSTLETPDSWLTYTAPSAKYIINELGILASASTIRPDHDPATLDTSTTSNTIGRGAQTFTTVASASQTAGDFVRISETVGSTTNYMVGTVTSHIGTTLIVDVLTAVGSGTISAWTIIKPFGVLVEEARTNVCLHNRDLTDAVWTNTNITATMDQTGVDGVANSASSILATAANGTSLQNITLASSARFQTAYVKRITGFGTINMTMDNGITWTVITVTSDWTKVTIPTQTLANPIVGFRIVTDTDEIVVDFVQNENGVFATSSIATVAATVTRAKDNISELLSAIPYNDAEGTVIINPRSGSLHDSLNAEALALNSVGGNNRLLEFQRLFAGGNASIFGTGIGSKSLGALNDFTSFKVAVGYKVNDYAWSKDGGTVGTDTVATVPIPTTIFVGQFGATTHQWGGHVAYIEYLRRRITNTELQSKST